MTYTNITVNGLRMPIPEQSTVKDIIVKFFDLRCEFLVNRNSKPVQSHRYPLCRVKENDNFQIITYSKNCYRIHKRSIFKPGTEKGEE